MSTRTIILSQIQQVAAEQKKTLAPMTDDLSLLDSGLDEVIVLEDGRLVARGSHDDLVDSNDVYREIYEHGQLERVFTEEVA